MFIEKTRKILCYIVQSIFLLCFLFVLGSIFFNNTSALYKFKSSILIIGIILYFGFIILTKYLFSKIKLKSDLIFVCFFIIYVILQITVISFLKIKPSWDYGIVFNAVIKNLKGTLSLNQFYYLYQFQNNVGYAYLLKLMLTPFYLIGVKSLLSVAMIINAIFIDVAIIFIYKIIKLLFEEKQRIVFILLTFLCYPLLFYIPITYTDTFSLPLVSIAMYIILYILKKKDFSSMKAKTLFFLLGLVIAAGMQLKLTIVILLIAFIITLVLFYNFKEYIKLIPLVIVGIIIIFVPVKLYTNSAFDKDGLKAQSVPPTHWIMMGLTNHGNYNDTEYQNTFTAGNYNAKKKYNIKVIKARLSSLAKDNKLIVFYSGKISFLMGDGTLYVPGLLCDAKQNNVYSKFVIGTGKHYGLFAYISQIKHYFMLLIIFLIPFLDIKDKSGNKSIKYFLLVSLIGVFMFFMMWEVSSRYLFHLIPLFFTTYFYGLSLIFNKISFKHDIIKKR